MLLLAAVLLALSCNQYEAQDAGDPFLEALPTRDSRLFSDGEASSTALERPLQPPVEGDNQRMPRPWRQQRQWRGTEEGVSFYRRLFERRPAQDTKESQHRFHAERHERCDDDLDCRISPSQVCVKRAHEPFGRCQCPFYRPVEVTVDAVPQCVTAKGLFDQCRMTAECVAVNPYLRCVNSLCVCTSPYVLNNKDQCRPASDLRQWLAWFVSIAVLLGVAATSLTCFLYRRRETAETRDSSHPPARPCPVAAAPAASELPGAAPLDGGRATMARLRVPPAVYRRMREWARENRARFPSAAPATPVFWAKQAFRQLPSPLYQGKLLRKIRPQRPMRKCSVAPLHAQRPASPAGFPPMFARSEESSSFHSFPIGEGATVQPLDDALQRHRGAADEEPPRRVSFAH
ncbi:hypothetical protein V5799_019756 [Amblyomma americanum]|uniref:Secreted protein n=1 Tax=Amblyomma americanum TaxID=6943 RepID=A0AAQ4EWP6_AMBAM